VKSTCILRFINRSSSNGLASVARPALSATAMGRADVVNARLYELRRAHARVEFEDEPRKVHRCNLVLHQAHALEQQPACSMCPTVPRHVGAAMLFIQMDGPMLPREYE
jgi:hypothetical protein